MVLSTFRDVLEESLRHIAMTIPTVGARSRTLLFTAPFCGRFVSELIRRRHPIKESPQPSLVDCKFELEEVLLQRSVRERTRVDRLVACISVELLGSMPRLLVTAPQIARCQARF